MGSFTFHFIKLASLYGPAVPKPLKFLSDLLVIVCFHSCVEILLDQLHGMHKLAHVFGQNLMGHLDLKRRKGFLDCFRNDTHFGLLLNL